MFRSLVEVESGRQSQDPAAAPLTAPARVVSRTYPGAPQKGDSIELQRVVRPDGPSVPTTPAADNGSYELALPTSPEPVQDVAEIVPSIWDPFMNRFRLLAVCIANLGNALNDSSAGALIPYMEK